jgi:hypothetical protein
MWCRQCRQDVPVQLPGAGQPGCCPRCGGKLVALCDIENGRTTTPEADAAGEYMSPVWMPELVESPPLYDSWEIDEQLRHLQRLLHGETKSGKKTTGQCDGREKTMRFDIPQSAVGGRHARESKKHADGKDNGVRVDRVLKTTSSRLGFSLMQWVVSAIGTACLTCGIVLSAWSLFDARNELWSVGLPALLAGQILLFVTWILQFGRLSRDNRTAAVQLNAMRRRLGKLRQLETK